jgi:hypothetical protein
VESVDEMKDYKGVDDCKNVNSVDSVDCKMEDYRNVENSECIEYIESIEESNVKPKKIDAHNIRKMKKIEKKKITNDKKERNINRIHKTIDENVC